MKAGVVLARLRTQRPPEVLRAITRQKPAATNRGPSAAGTLASRRLARRRPAAVALATLMVSTPLARNIHP